MDGLAMEKREGVKTCILTRPLNPSLPRYVWTDAFCFGHEDRKEGLSERDESMEDGETPLFEK